MTVLLYDFSFKNENCANCAEIGNVILLSRKFQSKRLLLKVSRSGLCIQISKFRQNTTGVEIIYFGISVGKEFEVFSVLKHSVLKITHKE